MTINKWLQTSRLKLRQAGIDSADLDSLLILEHVLNRNRANLLAHSDEEIDEASSRQLTELLDRRHKREPLAYILGHVEFYGHTFVVTDAVLIPRPETEAFIESILLMNTKGQRLLDVGCGSGAIGISAKLLDPTLDVTLLDIDQGALELAQENATRLEAPVKIKQNDLLSDIGESFDIIVANLPYVPKGHSVARELDFEPQQALFSGEDGLDHYRLFWQQLKNIQPTYVVTESLQTQHNEVTQLAKEAGFRLNRSQLLVQTFLRNEIKN